MMIYFRELAQYYRSAAFGKDYGNFARRNPDAAAYQLRLIIAQLNENLATLGITLTPGELNLQASFVSGKMPIPDMIELVKNYAATIDARWPS
jgi:hypothetical protein